MLRNYFVIMVAIGMLGAFMGRGQSGSSSREPEVLQQARDDEAEQIAMLKARDQAQFSSQDGTVELERSSDGHFYADVRINNSTVHMLVDTGASSIALSRDDARSAGIATSIGMNDVVGEGADGAVHGEYVRLDKVELGPLSAQGLDAVVLNNGEQSLLGQAFLSKFTSVQIEGDRMVLR